MTGMHHARCRRRRTRRTTKFYLLTFYFIRFPTEPRESATVPPAEVPRLYELVPIKESAIQAWPRRRYRQSMTSRSVNAVRVLADRDAFLPFNCLISRVQESTCCHASRVETGSQSAGHVKGSENS